MAIMTHNKFVEKASARVEELEAKIAEHEASREGNRKIDKVASYALTSAFIFIGIGVYLALFNGSLEFKFLFVTLSTISLIVSAVLTITSMIKDKKHLSEITNEIEALKPVLAQAEKGIYPDSSFFNE